MTQLQWAILALIGVCAVIIIAPYVISWWEELIAGFGDESASKNHIKPGDHRNEEKHHTEGK